MIGKSVDGLLRGAAAGLIGGAVVGIGEAAALVWSMAGTADRWALPYASVLYGLIGAGMGAAAGALLGAVAAMRRRDLDGPRHFALGLLAPLGPLGLVILLWTLRRDFYAEQMPPPPVLLGAAAAWAVLCVVAWFVAASATRKSFLSFVLRPAGAVAAWAGLVLLAWLGTFGGTPAGSADQPKRGSIPDELAERPNIIVLMVDTLRADALGVYGKEGNPSPNIDALARDSIVYDQAIAQASWTRASIASFLTSMFPSTHNAFRKADALPPDVETVSEVLLSRGYYTGALVNNTNVTRQFGFAQGFGSFRYLEPEPPFWGTGSAYFLSMYSVLRKVHERAATYKTAESVYWDAPRVTEAAIEWMEKYRSDRFFLLLHYMDPHDPYFRHPYDGYGYSRAEHEKPDPAMTAELLRLYDGEVRYLDEHLAPLVAYLKEKGLYDQTVIVLTADHGEEFNEHGGFWHGTTLYDEQVRVPLTLKLPRQERAGTVVHEVVRAIDVAPTLADLAGAGPDGSWQGTSLLDDWNSRPDRDRKAFSEEDFEGNQLQSLRGGTHKIILANPGNPRGVKECELYDVAQDPGEKNDLCASADPALVTVRDAMKLEVEAAQAYARGKAVEKQEAGMDAATCEKLKLLGYVDASVDCGTYGTGAAAKAP